MSVPRQDKAADYRRQAHDARAMANWISLEDHPKQHLLEVARHLEALAETEEREAWKASSTVNPQPEA